MQIALVAVGGIETDVASINDTPIGESEIVIVLRRINLYPLGQAGEDGSKNRSRIVDLESRLMREIVNMLLIGAELKRHGVRGVRSAANRH